MRDVIRILRLYRNAILLIAFLLSTIVYTTTLRNVFAQQPTYRIFVTSTTQTGNFGGLTEADNICQSLAATAGKGDRIWKAWLSTSTKNARDEDRIPNGRFTTINGSLIADSKGDLLDGKIGTDINRDEWGRTVADSKVWTGTEKNGTAHKNTCDDWKNTNKVSGQRGKTNSTGSGWTASGNDSCSNRLRLYCVEVGAAPTNTPTPTPSTTPTPTVTPTSSPTPTPTEIPTPTPTLPPDTTPTDTPTPTQEAPTPTPVSPLATDVDRNGCVGIVDFNIWLQAFQTGTVAPNTFPDINGNESIDIVDFNQWIRDMVGLPADKLCQ